ncbi:MAG: UMP kinase [Alphaproteobacteria bacterium]|nr:UMP kinase [Alphaproteobacteria bacterium]
MPNHSHNPRPAWKRVMVKLSGEALMGQQQYGLDSDVLVTLAEEIKSAVARGFQICMVVGGGNIFRGMGSNKIGIDRTTGDYMGMLATVINALALQNTLEKIGVPTRVLSALPITAVAENYIRRRALRHLEKGRVIIFAAGTGNPYFTTDTAAALRAAEMECQLLMKATKVDGVYSDDPMKNKNAVRYPRLSFAMVIEKNFGVMDINAVVLCRDNNIPISVFSLFDRGQLLNILEQKNDRHTFIDHQGHA